MVFRLLFLDKVRLLSLYNALSTRRCDNVDVLIGTDIYLWEHQSTMQRSARRAERKGHKRKPSLQRGAFHGIQVAGTVCKDDVLA